MTFPIAAAGMDDRERRYQISRSFAMSAVRDNPAKHRFELEEQGLIAFADYRRTGDVLIIPHVEAPMALRGDGTAGRLMQGALDLVRERGLKIVPSCPYAAAFIRRHKQYEDLLA